MGSEEGGCALYRPACCVSCLNLRARPCARRVRRADGRARRQVGMPDFRFHDLRHTGQTMAAATGATIKDLMRRLGHASPAASYRYLHAVDGRDAEIASALSELAAHGDAAKLPRSIVVKH